MIVDISQHSKSHGRFGSVITAPEQSARALIQNMKSHATEDEEEPLEAEMHGYVHSIAGIRKKVKNICGTTNDIACLVRDIMLELKEPESEDDTASFKNLEDMFLTIVASEDKKNVGLATLINNIGVYVHASSKHVAGLMTDECRYGPDKEDVHDLRPKECAKPPTTISAALYSIEYSVNRIINAAILMEGAVDQLMPYDKPVRERRCLEDNAKIATKPLMLSVLTDAEEILFNIRKKLQFEFLKEF